MTAVVIGYECDWHGVRRPPQTQGESFASNAVAKSIASFEEEAVLRENMVRIYPQWLVRSASVSFAVSAIGFLWLLAAVLLSASETQLWAAFAVLFLGLAASSVLLKIGERRKIEQSRPES